MPRAEGVLGEPSPQSGLADGGDEPPLDGFAANLRHREAGEGKTMLVRQFTREGFDGDHDAGGKRALDGRAALPLRGQQGVVRRTACAIC